MADDTRCKALTTKGERCKNAHHYGDYCYIHRDQEAEKKKPKKMAAVTTFLSASASFVVVIEKAVQYWPEIVEWISMIDASTKSPSARPMTFKMLKGLLEEGETGPFPSFARILEWELKSSPDESEYRQRSRTGLDRIPPNIQQELIAGCEGVLRSSKTLFEARDVERREIGNSTGKLLDLLEQSADAAPDFPLWIAESLADLRDFFKPEWWDLKRLRREHKTYTWRASALAEHLAGQLSAARDGQVGAYTDVYHADRRVSEIVFSIPQSLLREILETCEAINAHTKRLQDLGGGL